MNIKNNFKKAISFLLIFGLIFSSFSIVNPMETFAEEEEEGENVAWELRCFLDENGEESVEVKTYTGEVADDYSSVDIKKYFIEIPKYTDDIYVEVGVDNEEAELEFDVSGFQDGQLKNIQGSVGIGYKSKILTQSHTFKEHLPFDAKVFKSVDNSGSNYYCFAIINSYADNRVEAIVLLKFLNNESTTVNKKPLEDAIARAMGVKESGKYYTQNDRYRGNKYNLQDASKHNRWKKFQDILYSAERENALSPNQDTVDSIAGELNAAIDALIPKTEVNATQFYEDLYKLKRACWLIENGKDVIGYGTEVSKINTDNTTLETYEKYKQAIDEADALLDNLYTGENKPSSYNNIENNSNLGNELEAAIEKIEVAIKGLKRKFTDIWDIAPLKTAYVGIKLYANELYDNQTDVTYLAARAEALKFLEKTPPPNEGVKREEIQPYYDMYQKIREAYHGIGGRSGKTVNVKLSFADASPWSMERLKFRPEIIPPEKIVEAENIELKPGEASVYKLLEKAGIGKSDIYINGIYQSIVYDKTYRYSISNSNVDTGLNDGDEVTVVRYAYPKVLHFEEHGYQTVPEYKIMEHIKHQTLTLGDSDISAGKSFKLKAEAKKASVLHYSKNAEPEAAAGGEIYISRAYPTEAEARKSLVYINTEITTDSKGEAELKLYEEGWYALNVFHPNKWEGWVCNGPNIVFQVKKSDDVAGIKAELKAKLDSDYAKYGKEYFDTEDWEKIEKAYTEGKANLEAATVGKDMAKAVNDALAVIKEVQKKAEGYNDQNLKKFNETIDKFPEDLSKLDKAATDEIANLQSYYSKMTAYQQGRLSPDVKQKYENIVAKKGNLQDAKEYGLKFKVNMDSVVERDREGLNKILEYLKNNTPTDDVLTPETGGNKLANLFTFNSKGEDKNGFVFESFEKANAFKKDIYACVNPDYTAYLMVRDADKSAKFNELNIEGGKISDKDISIDFGNPKDKDDATNARLQGKMAYIVNGNAYEVKDIKIKGLDKYKLETVRFYDYSFYKGKTDGPCNMHVPNSFVIFNMPYEDVEIEVVFGSKYGSAKEIQSAKESAKLSVEAAFNSYKQSNYSEENWKKIEAAKSEALQKIEHADTIDKVNKARTEGLSAMAIVKKQGQETASPIVGAPESGSIKGQVHISVRNDTFLGGAWTGEILDGWYDFGENDTMMILILKALKAKGFSWNGTVGMGGPDAADYGITYISYIYKDLNGDGKWNKGKEPKLGEFDGEGGSGWMGTLNDWFTNEGFQSFGYKNGWLHNNDEISIMFTQNLGVDLGGSWGNSDTRLKDLRFSKGTLMPSFNKDKYTYDLMIPDKTASIVVTPTAANKNYLVKTFLNLYNNEGSYYRRPETIGVKAGDVIYIGVGDRRWPSMNKQGAEARYYEGTKYAIRIQTAGVDSIAGRIAELPDVKRITVNNYIEYEQSIETLYNQYEKLSNEDKAKINKADSDRLKELNEKIKFFSAIGKVKDILSKLPNSEKASENQIRASKSKIEEASKLYEALSAEQKKYITIADSKNYNEILKKLKELKVEVKAGGISGSSEEPVNSVVVEPKAEVKGDKAVAKVDVAKVTQVIKEAAKQGEKTIVIEPTGTKEAKEISVSIPKAAAEAIAEKKDMSVSVETKSGQVNIPAVAMEGIVKEAKGAEISVDIALKEQKEVKVEVAKKILENKDAVAVEVKIASAGKRITKFSKAIEIMLPVGDKFEVGKNYPVTQISEDGTVSNPVGKCVKVGGKYYVKVSVNHLSTFVVNPEPISNLSFTDIEGHWAYDAIKYAVEKKLMNGVSDSAFAPDFTLSRAMLTTILYRMEKEPKVVEALAYGDVAKGEWYADAVAWASKEGIVTGYSDSVFAPNDNITREQMAAMLMRYSKYKKMDVSKTKDMSAFKDANSISSWARDAMSWAGATGLVNGRTADTIVPSGTATRAEAATILKRYMENVVNTKETAEADKNKKAS